MAVAASLFRKTGDGSTLGTPLIFANGTSYRGHRGDGDSTAAGRKAIWSESRH
jgi:hypothetical protein